MSLTRHPCVKELVRRNRGGIPGQGVKLGRPGSTSLHCCCKCTHHLWHLNPLPGQPAVPASLAGSGAAPAGRRDHRPDVGCCDLGELWEINTTSFKAQQFRAPLTSNTAGKPGLPSGTPQSVFCLWRTFIDAATSRQLSRAGLGHGDSRLANADRPAVARKPSPFRLWRHR